MWQFNYDENNSSNNSWTKILPGDDNIPDTRNGHTLIEYKSKLFLFGGIHDITHEKNDLFVIDPSNPKWMLSDVDTSHNHEVLSEDEDVKSRKDKQDYSSNFKQIDISQIPRAQNSYSSPKILFKVASPRKAEYQTLKQQHTSKTNASSLQISTITYNQFDSQPQADPQEEMRKKQKFLKKMDLLSNFELNEEELKSGNFQSNSPTTEAMRNSINNVGNAAKKKNQLHNQDVTQSSRQKAFKFNDTKIIGRRPCARDGHSSIVSDEGQCVIFGGDRHLMSYNDIYIVDFNKVLEKLNN